MNILLTGGSGFIGRNLYEGLKDKFNIFKPTRQELDLLHFADIENYLQEKRIEIIIHSAIEGGPDTLDHALRMFAGLLRNIKIVDKIIHFGSGAEFAKTRNLVKIPENKWGEYIPEDNYGLAKYIIHSMAKNEEKVLNLRLFGVYGKYENYRLKFISNSIVKNLLGLPIRIKQDVIFDYLYIDDLVRITEYFIRNSWSYNSYNITPEKSITLTEIAGIINKMSEKPSDVHTDNPGLNYQYTGGNKRLIKELGDFSFTTYEEGIKSLYEYYRLNVDLLDKESIIKDVYYTLSKIKNS